MKNTFTKIYFSINIIGVILIFYFAYRVVALAKLEERNYYDSIDSITFTIPAIPVLAVCFLLNIIWVIKTIIEIFKMRSYSSSYWFLAVLTVWLASFLVIKFIA